MVVEISARSPGFENGSALGSGYLEFPASVDVDFNGRLVVDFVGDVADGRVDIGDTWEIGNSRRAVTGVTGAEAPEFRYNGGQSPGTGSPGATLEIVQYDRALTSGVPIFNLTVRVVPSGGLTDYYTWASERGFPDTLLRAGGSVRRWQR